ncbi:MAG: LLM class F420-dependent oxidoreductase [Porticoccaceae bacterium]|nr:MAG: LLM class F420-dependent oxidoreductase [Porticoccaceae bacterium]
MALGPLGVWAVANLIPAGEAEAFARRVEAWGYSTLWVPEITAKDPLVLAAFLLSATRRLTLATGIASLYLRHPAAMENARRALAEHSSGRFLLGLGVSHGPFVEGVLGLRWERPVERMRRYLEAMAQAPWTGPDLQHRAPLLLGVTGPKMLALAAELADGAHPYNVTPEHTATAREILGPGKLLCPEQKVLLETDPERARAVARRALALSLSLPNYRKSYLRQGFTEADLEGGGSDRLVDAIVAWGDEEAIRRRIQAHFDAGADHVAIQPLGRQGPRLSAEDERVLALLAPA